MTKEPMISQRALDTIEALHLFMASSVRIISHFDASISIGGLGEDEIHTGQRLEVYTLSDHLASANTNINTFFLLFFRMMPVPPPA